jgi:hypothetical protein
MTEKRIRWLLLVPACAAVAAAAHFASVRDDADISIDDDIATHLEDAIICNDGDRRTEWTLETGEAGASRLPNDSSIVDESI